LRQILSLGQKRKPSIFALCGFAPLRLCVEALEAFNLEGDRLRIRFNTKTPGRKVAKDYRGQDFELLLFCVFALLSETLQGFHLRAFAALPLASLR